MSTDHTSAVSAQPSTTDGAVSLTGHTRSAWPLPEVALTMTDQSGAQVARTHSDSDGQFGFSGIRPGTYILIGSKDGYQPRAEAVMLAAAGPHRIELSLDPAARVYGVVHERRSGKPIPAAAVSAIGSDGEVVASTLSEPDGRYCIAGIAAATVTLVVAVPATDPAATLVQLDAGGGIPDQVVDLAVETYGTLSGTVTADGRALAALSLSLYDHDGQLIDSTITDDNGMYRFDRVKSGKYTVRSRARGPQATPIPPETTQVNVSLSPV